MKLRTLIVEDEPLSQHYLNSLLSQLPEVEVAARAATEEDAITAIESLKPDLVLLDIELHNGTGFEVLCKTRHLHYMVIFTTALEQQAIRMIKLCGVPFLQKPIDAEELYLLIKNLPGEDGEARKALDYLLKALESDHVPQYMSLQGEGPRQYIALDDVLYMTSGNPTTLKLRDGTVKTDLRSIKELESLLEDVHFFRSAATHLVNLKNVEAIAPGEDSIRLLQGAAVPLSPKKRGSLSERLERL
jgi:two-component system LytT family response regulator